MNVIGEYDNLIVHANKSVILAKPESIRYWVTPTGKDKILFESDSLSKATQWAIDYLSCAKQ
jgi:hypothetical protein